MSVCKKKIIQWWVDNWPDNGGGFIGDWGFATLEESEGINYQQAIRECFCCGRTCSTTIHHIIPLQTIECPPGMIGKERRIYRQQQPELNKENNLHLLCERCHKLAPHTPDTEVYWIWFNNMPCYTTQLWDSVRRGMQQSKMTDYECEVLDKEYPGESLRNKFRQLRDELGFSHPLNNLIDTIIPSTITKIVLDMRREHQCVK